MKYKPKADETLSHIARIHYGHSKKYVYLTAVNGTLFFRANDGVNGAELWRSDGTADSTVMVADINGDGNADLFDIDPFVLAVTSTADEPLNMFENEFVGFGNYQRLLTNPMTNTPAAPAPPASVGVNIPV